MPQVSVDGKVKKFAYTPEGMAKANRLALRTGGKLKKRKKNALTAGRAVRESTEEMASQLAENTLSKNYRQTKDNVVKKNPVTGLDYMRVPELEYDRQLRMKKEKKEKYKAGARRRAKEIRAKNPNAPWWGKKK